MITIDPSIEALTDAGKIELIERLEASLSPAMSESWMPQPHVELLAERERQERAGTTEVLDMDELERRVMGAKL